MSLGLLELHSCPSHGHSPWRSTYTKTGQVTFIVWTAQLSLCGPERLILGSVSLNTWILATLNPLYEMGDICMKPAYLPKHTKSSLADWEYLIQYKCYTNSCCAMLLRESWSGNLSLYIPYGFNSSLISDPNVVASVWPFRRHQAPPLLLTLLLEWGAFVGHAKHLSPHSFLFFFQWSWSLTKK